MNIDNSTFNIAFKYHTLGLCVIPSGGGTDGKAALIQWKRYQAERPTNEQMESWQSELKPAVWAMVTGKISGCFVIDCDTEESTAMMEAAGLKAHVRTEKGRHFYVCWPSQAISNSVGILPGVDIRGEGGYVNFAGKNDKVAYEVLVTPTEESLLTIEQLPAELQEALKPKAKNLADRILENAVDKAQQGNRNDTGWDLACQLRDNRFPQGDAENIIKRYVAEVGNTGTEPYTEQEAMDSVKSAYAGAAREPWHAEQPELAKAKRGFNWDNFAITHDSLLDKELAPLEYLVEDLLTIPGMAILAGKKKSGKSWMVLQLAQSVASGSLFLEKATQQGEVIYLALEDGERRLKQRLEMQHTVRGLPITYITNLPPLNTREGMEALKEIITTKHPRLVVIDTFAKAKNRFIDENEAGAIGDLLNQLHSIAIAEDMLILLVAHHGKASYNDPGFDIRGSSAIPGATDTNLGLYKNSDGTFDLRAEGRDIGEIDLRIIFDKEQTWCWQCRGDARDIRREEADNLVLNAIVALGGEADTLAIAKEVGVSRTATSLRLQRLKGEGVVGHKPIGKGTGVLYYYPLTALTGLTTTNPLTGLTTSTEEEELLSAVRGETSKATLARAVNPVSPCRKTGLFEFEDKVDIVAFYGGPEAYAEQMKRQEKAGGTSNPSLSCPCGSTKTWTRPDGARLCSQCHPQPAKEKGVSNEN